MTTQALPIAASQQQPKEAPLEGTAVEWQGRIYTTAYLTRAEWEAVQASRKVDAFRAGRERTLVLYWNGVRLRVLDTSQVSL